MSEERFLDIITSYWNKYLINLSCVTTWSRMPGSDYLVDWLADSTK